MEITLGGNYASLDNQADLDRICRETLAWMDSKTGSRAPDRDRPIFVTTGEGLHIRPDPEDGLPQRYVVSLVHNGEHPGIFAFELIQELGHFFMSPPWTANSWFIETCCYALSLAAMHLLGDKQERPSLNDMAGHIACARGWQIDKPLDIYVKHGCLSKKEESDIRAWVADKLPDKVRISKADGHSDICGIYAEPIFLEYFDCWPALCQLGRATYNGKTDYKKWLGIVDQDHCRFVEALTADFQDAIDAEWPEDD